jgi:hypothetical protein
LSEENPFEATPSEEIPPIPEISEVSSPEIPAEIPLAETPAQAPSRHRPRWVAPAWFFLGVIVGIAGFAAYDALIVRTAAPAASTQAESVDPNTAMRAAARDGVLEAIATLQAGGGQQPSAAQEPQGPQEVASNAFAVRDSNRQGNANATVTIYEFSDFQ